MFSLHPSLYFFLKSFFHLFLMSTLVPDENSMEDPLCNSSFGSMVSLGLCHTRHRISSRNNATQMLHPTLKMKLGNRFRQDDGKVFPDESFPDFTADVAISLMSLGPGQPRVGLRVTPSRLVSSATCCCGGF